MSEQQSVLVVENGRGIGKELGFLNQEQFSRETQWLTGIFAPEKYGDKAAARRVNRGLSVAWEQILEATSISEVFEDSSGSWFDTIKERLNTIRPRETVFAGESLCIDGRISRYFRFMPRLLSSISTPAALLEAKTDLDGNRTLIASEDLAANIEWLLNKDLVVMESTGPHHSFRHGTDEGHPLGCGAFQGWLKSDQFRSQRFAWDYADGGVALDLVREDRTNSDTLLTRKGAQVVRRIIDTDTQGIVLIGDELYNDTKNAIEGGDYLPLTLDAVTAYHLSEGPKKALYTVALAEEMQSFFEDGGWQYKGIDWDDISSLKDNLQQCIDLTLAIVESDWGVELKRRLYDLYGQQYSRRFGKTLAADMIQELLVQTAYNTSVIWLSGFNDEANVPHRFKHHSERYGVIGDKGFDNWIENSPFLLAASEDPSRVHENLDLMMSLLPGIVRGAHGVNLEEEALVLFVTGAVDPGGTEETQRRAEAALRDRFQKKMEHLEQQQLISQGRIVLIPLMMDEKTRKPLYVPDLRRKFGMAPHRR